MQGFGFDGASGRFYISFPGDLDGYEYEGHPAPLPWAQRVYVLDEASSLPSPTATTTSVADTATRSATFRGEVYPKGGLVSSHVPVLDR